MRTFQLIIFDLDGTLVNSYPAIIASTNYVLKRLGVPAQSDAVIRRAVGRGDKELIASFVNKKNRTSALAMYRQHHRGSLRTKSFLMPHARRLLRYLTRRGYRLAIASNRPRAFVDRILKHLRIEGLFESVLCKDQVAFGKPHPNIINRIIKQFKVCKQRVLYVGDMAIDVKTGKRAAVATCAIATGSSSFAELRGAHPDFLYRNLSPLGTRL